MLVVAVDVVVLWQMESSRIHKRPLRKQWPTQKPGPYQEEENVVVVAVVVVILVVHDESGVHMAQVVKVVHLGEGFVGELSLAVEALEQVVTW